MLSGVFLKRWVSCAFFFPARVNKSFPFVTMYCVHGVESCLSLRLLVKFVLFILVQYIHIYIFFNKINFIFSSFLYIFMS